MAISKLILNGVTQMDVTSDTVSAGKLLSGETATKNDGTKVTGNIAFKTATNLTASGSTVTVPSGYYSSQVTKNVPEGTWGNLYTSASYLSSNHLISLYMGVSGSGGYYGSNANRTYTSSPEAIGMPVLAAQTITPGSVSQYISSYQWLTGSQTIVGDANLVPSNIASGVSIFGVNGTHEGGDGGEYYDAYKALACNSSQINSTISSISECFNTLSIIPSGAFAYRDISGSFTFSNVSFIGSYAFASFSTTNAGVTYPDFNINLPIIESIGALTFINNNNLNMVNAPSCSFIGSSAFRCCIELTSFIAPNCEIIDTYAFSECRRLQYSYFYNVISIGYGAFAYCYGAAVYLSLSRCTYVGNNAFYCCSGMRTADLPVCSYIGSYAFQSCSKLSQANCPLCETLGSGAFASCSSLATLSIPICKSIGNSAFRNDGGLQEIYLTSVSSVTSLGGSSVFYNANPTSIYVPSSLYSSFLTAQYWSQYSSRIVSV